MANTRQTKSKEKIRAAFTQLMNTKGFEAMTVSDIAREAHVNRGTFYMHYIDKFDLRTQLLEEEIDTLTNLIINSEPLSDETQDTETPDKSDPCNYIPNSAILAAITHIKDNYDFFWAISEHGTNMKLHTTMQETLKQLILSQTHNPEYHIDYPGIPEIYAQEILVSAITSIIWLWLRRGCKEDPELIVDIIDRNKTLSPIALLR
ncbi:TetR/AcrR family transcriptional regulator [Bifidobacterium oedipodis]|uniref:TetR family transcriptional regulator n=1 Tax=Bifidobacterium oedipodis TaxID=2675322 RepID=A0A7Y0HTS2_9BIFI|nr:TetR/AcrR family transcriptional regulator [Bifidobacterium sp. DSM 109957]NMM94382.1 TetR family transcriptional regulator [Bifidobacterium sp. DSM 109957]